VDRAHAKALQLKFEDRGIPTAYMDAHTPREEREEIRQRFHAGEIKIVCNVGVLTTGIDWDVRCLVLARPTKSEILFVQIVGRALRTAEGKDHALILDHSDNHLRLGFVTDIHHEKLDDGKTKERAKQDGIKLPTECPQCHFLKPPRTARCPACGFIAQAVSKTAEQPGELEELDRKKTAMRFPDKATTYGMLKKVAADRGYDEGWASHKFRTIYGVWPNFYKDAPLAQPSDDLISWIRSQQIRWAKSKSNPRNAEARNAA
jgi:superfamily II DNA or RNA helicase